MRRSRTWGFGLHSCMKPEAVGNGRRTVEGAAGRPRSDASWLPVSWMSLAKYSTSLGSVSTLFRERASHLLTAFHGLEKISHHRPAL